MADLINLLGMVAAVTGISMTGSFFLQAIKIWKNKSAKDVSLLMFVVSIINFVLWTAYGYLIKSWIIFSPNAVGIVAASTVIALVFRFKNN
ncbi:MAG TPA: hypothetical protein HA224_00215 [Nanoarchaeota archaeon]|nr:hypothetical protein [Nanoarchaeota archaeon]